MVGGEKIRYDLYVLWTCTVIINVDIIMTFLMTITSFKGNFVFLMVIKNERVIDNRIFNSKCMFCYCRTGKFL